MYQSVFAIIAAICVWIGFPILLAVVKPRNAGGLSRIKTAFLFTITYTFISYAVGKITFKNFKSSGGK